MRGFMRSPLVMTSPELLSAEDKVGDPEGRGGALPWATRRVSEVSEAAGAVAKVSGYVGGGGATWQATPGLVVCGRLS